MPMGWPRAGFATLPEIGIVVAALAACAGCGGRAPAPSNGDAPAARARGFAAPMHQEDADDGVDLTSSRGVLDPEQIRASVEPMSNELSACYISRVGARSWLGGQVSMKWQLSADGEIRDVHVADSNLGAWPVEKCLLGVARKMKFSAPRGGPADFLVPLEFSATGTAAVWDERRSREAIGDQLSKLSECRIDPALASEAAAAARSGKSGKLKSGKLKPASPAPVTEAPREVVITVYVGAHGLPQSVGFATPEPHGWSETWAECAEKVALAWRIPDSRGAVAKLAVRYLGEPQ